MESTYEPETTEEVTTSEDDNFDELESEVPEEVESSVESTEEDLVSVSENEIETEVNSTEEETTTEEFALYDDTLSEADVEAIVLAIDQQTEVIKSGNIAICAILGLLIGIVFIQGFKLGRV